VLTWGSVQANPHIQSAPVFQIEDGFLRSIGLGAALVPPFSLVKDDLGIYYDPSRESRLEKLIQSPMPAGGKQRVERLIGQIIKSGISKYNLDGQIPATFSAGKCILVPGQVEDDASIRLGTVQVCTNLALLEVTRRENPEAVIVYKPHPDVEAGLRKGAIDPVRAAELANHIVALADPVALIAACDEVWTMTSLLGFEALMRDKPVVCLGAPFYAGWGLTKDLGSVPTRRRFAPDGHPLPRPDLASLVYATLIAYPRYYDPVTRSACSPEAIVYRLGQHKMPARSYGLRLLAKLQGRFSTYAYLWR
jgi:capsular polysaccharide export protein